jgi:hypothetical protein
MHHALACQEDRAVMSLELHRVPRCPLGLLIVGWAFIAIGVWSVWGIIEDARNSRIHLALDVLLIPVGIGLLRGRPLSIIWAQIWIGLGAMCFGILLVWYPFTEDRWSISLGSSEVRGWQRHFAALIPPIVGLILARMAWRAVSSKAAEDFVESRTLHRRPTSLPPSPGRDGSQ